MSDFSELVKVYADEIKTSMLGFSDVFTIEIKQCLHLDTAFMLALEHVCQFSYEVTSHNPFTVVFTNEDDSIRFYDRVEALYELDEAISDLVLQSTLTGEELLEYFGA